MIHLKISLGNELRRTKISKNIQLFSEVESKIKNVFPQLSTNSEPITIKYRDEENDWILLENIDDWQEAQQCAFFASKNKNDYIVRLKIEVGDEQNDNNDNASKNQLQNTKITDIINLLQSIVLQKSNPPTPTAQPNVITVEVDTGKNKVSTYLGEPEEIIGKGKQIIKTEPIAVVEEPKPQPVVEPEIKPEPEPEPEPVPEPVPEPIVEPEPEPVVEPEPQPVVELGCSFVTDITVPDGTVIPTGSQFIKTWRLKNTGNAYWPNGSRLQWVSGTPMFDSNDSVLVKSAAPGEEVDISLTLLSPQFPGNYRTYFKMFDGNNQEFGHKCWVEINVTPAIQPQPIVQPQPVVQPKVDPKKSIWEEKLVLLAEMGFTDRDRCIDLLNKNNGDIPRVINILFGN